MLELLLAGDNGRAMDRCGAGWRGLPHAGLSVHSWRVRLLDEHLGWNLVKAHLVLLYGYNALKNAVSHVAFFASISLSESPAAILHGPKVGTFWPVQEMDQP